MRPSPSLPHLRNGLATALLCLTLVNIARPASLAITWHGGASGSWQDAANWSPALTPGGPGGEEHAVTIAAASVSLAEDSTVASLALDGVALSGPRTLTCSYTGITFSGGNTFAPGLRIVALQDVGFANAESSLTNHGTLLLGKVGGLVTEIGAAPLDPVGTLINAFDGVLRFNPNTVTPLQFDDGTSGVFVEPVGVGGDTPFGLFNLGTILVDESRGVTVNAPLLQHSAARLVVGPSASISFGRGGSIAGDVQLDASAQVWLGGTTGPYGEPLERYLLDQTRVSGGGVVQAEQVILSGSLGSGPLRADGCEIEQAFNNHGDLVLGYCTLRGGFVNHLGARLRWLYGTTLAIPSRLTNRGTLQFDRGGAFYGSGFAGYSATIENAPGGLIRFDPAGPGRVWSGIGTPPFKIENAGTVLADNLPTPGYNLPNFLSVPLLNTGLVRVTAGSALAVNPSTFSQTAGETRIEDAELVGSDTVPLAFAGGLLRATGKISGHVALGAGSALEIGSAQTAGTLRVTRSLVLSPGSELRLDLLATDAGACDQLLVTGALQLDGRLRLRLAPGLAATLTPETTFTLASAATVTGAFAHLHDGRVWTTDGSGSFQVTTTLSSLVLADYRPASTALEGWQHRFWPDSADPTVDGRPDADPDADGLPNLLEYALGHDPTAPHSTPWCDMQVDAALLRLTFTPRATAGLIYAIQSSGDLENWQTAPLPDLVPDAPFTYVDTSDLAAGESRFLRLVVAPAPDVAPE